MVSREASSGCATGLRTGLPSSPIDMAELILLLPLSQAHALEQAAQRLGLSTGQLLRQLVHSFLMQQQAPTEFES